MFSDFEYARREYVARNHINNLEKKYFYDFILQVLSVYAKYNLQSFLTYRTDGEYAPVTFWAESHQNLFAPIGTFDVTLTPENLPLLEKALEDVDKASNSLLTHCGLDLFICRMNKRKPNYEWWHLPAEATLMPQSETCIKNEVGEYIHNHKHSPLFLKIKPLFDCIEESGEILEI